MLWNEVEAAAGDFRQPFGKRETLGKQIMAAQELDQKINIAVRSLLATCHRAERADPSRAVLTARGVDGLSLSLQLFQQHGQGPAKRVVHLHFMARVV